MPLYRLNNTDQFRIGFRGGEFARKLGGKALEFSTKFVNLRDFVSRRNSNRSPFVRCEHNEALRLQLAKSLADGGATDAEPLAKFLLPQTSTGRQLLRHDFRFDPECDLVCQAGYLDARGWRFCCVRQLALCREGQGD